MKAAEPHDTTPAVTLATPPEKTPLPDKDALPEGTDQVSDTRHNFLVMVGYQVVMRTGWIFKTESIIMPAVLDTLGGSAWLRSCLPLLNRFGQSIPPLFAAPHLREMRRKKVVLFCATSMMAVSFLVLALAWFLVGSSQPWWLPYAFLLVYGLFFTSTGINQLAFGTLQGKLIETTNRGRLMLVSNMVGATLAIACAAFLLPQWLTSEGGVFGLLFGFTGICFLAAAAVAWQLREPPDEVWFPDETDETDLAESPRPRTRHRVFANAWRTLREDSNFRLLAIVAALFGCSVMLFPHYQALGLEKLGLKLDSLILWVILQNAGTALFSFVAGPIADRSGNRRVLRILMLAICSAPLAALGFQLYPGMGRVAYSLVFVLVGLTPVAIKIFNNYTLELSGPSDHPRYLSTLSLCFGAPVLFAPLAGSLIDTFDFAPVFLTITGLTFTGWLLTFYLHEPRIRR